MPLHQRFLSISYKVGILAISFFGISSLTVRPTFAQTASASGAAVLVRPSGGSISISGEIILPSGYYYQGPLEVSPVYGGTSGENSEVINALTINPGTAQTITSTPTSNPFVQSASNALNSASGGTLAGDVADVAAIIRAGAGVNGLVGGLE
ncbi:hypothetical protein [Nostoc parmelioides]|uniref:Uncharacterized protein n=1 Tax=Nostoc parmelioides FACHB-3921 TaxID=2692909 RepID=A0ABR8BKC4_9NOSO|nr:hypothetical protein [Nostoc parmelioides]MBD2254547.1 hypothetical protein [Nostoc parmelioides FACHB-3921]